MWIQSRIQVYRLLHLFPDNAHTQQWRSRLLSLNILPATYTWQFYQHHNVVYIKLPHTTHLHFFYIGSTGASTAGRERTRRAKFLQVCQNKLVNAELALRWWKLHDNYYNYSTIAIVHAESSIQALVKEHQLIQLWQPPLNFPHVVKLLASPSGVVKTRSAISNITHTTVGRKLCRKLRRRHAKLHPTGHPCLHTYSVPQSWSILINIAQRNNQSYQQLKQLRKSHYTTDNIYALYKMAATMEEPHKSSVRSKLAKCLRDRNLTVPRNNVPLCLPYLAHTGFQLQVRNWIRQQLQNNINQTIPFHLPSTQVVQQAHPTLESALMNWKTWMKTFSEDPPTTCQCKQLLLQHPNLTHKNGHIISPAGLLSLPEQLIHLLSTSSASCYYPAKITYFATATEQITAWLKRHGLPLHLLASWDNFLQQQWPLHLQSSAQNQAFTFNDLAQLRTILQPLVVHNKDHAAHCFYLYCPIHYHHVLQQTFHDDKVFQTIDSTPIQFHANFKNMVPKEIYRTYKWAIDYNQPLPGAYVFLKEKKHFDKARPVVSFATSPIKPLLRALATTLFDIILIAYPLNLHRHNIPQTWQAIHAFLATVSMDQPLEMDNDDLSGFYTSIPQDRILNATRHAISRYLQRNPSPQSQADIRFTVNHSNTVAAGRVFRSSFKRTNPSVRVIWMKHVLILVELSLRSSMFDCCGTIFRQIRGSCIGSPLSPVLCNICAAFEEDVGKCSQRNAALRQDLLPCNALCRQSPYPPYATNHSQSSNYNFPQFRLLQATGTT